MRVMAQVAVCPVCSKRLPANATFCRRCGHRVHAPPRPTGQARVQPAAGGGRIFFVIVAVVVLSLVAGVLLRVLNRATARTAELSSVPIFTPPPPPLAIPTTPPLPPLPPLPNWERHLPRDLPPVDEANKRLDFRGRLLNQSRFIGESLDDAVFAGAELSQVSFEKADLRGADFRGAYLLQTNLGGADLAGAKFDEAFLSQSYLDTLDTGAVNGQTRVRNGITEPVPPPVLRARNAWQASFVRTRFQQSSLAGLNLSGADFHEASFHSVNLTNADLRNANLRGTRHSGTDFQGARLEGADLRGADLTFVSNLTAAQLRYARTDSSTRLPRF